MRTVLCYGDSNTFGQTAADTPHHRYGPEIRWPCVMKDALGPGWMVIEEGLSGRTTVHDDPIEGPEKNGRTYLKPCLESHRPLDAVIVMLGTNDLKARFHSPASEIAMGVQALVQDIRAIRPGPDEGVPEIIVAAPPPIREDLGGWEAVFAGGRDKSLALAAEYRAVAMAQGCFFFDAGQVAEAGTGDGFHLDPDGHRALGLALAQELVEIFGVDDA